MSVANNKRKHPSSSKRRSVTESVEMDNPVLKRIKQPFKTFEEALKRAGVFGRYQIFTCFVIQYASIMWAGNYSFMSLGRIEPDWVCDDEIWNSTRYNAPNNGSSQFCFMINNCSNLTTINDQFTSLVEEWRLVCDLSFVPDFLLRVYVASRIVGSIFGGHIGDHLGRKKGFFSAQFFILVTSVMAICAKTWQAFAVFQCLNGFFFGIIEVTSLALMMEYTDSKHRLIPNAMFQWCIGYMVLALIAWITANWRMYLVFVNLVSAPLLVGYLLFQESPRWLFVKGRLGDAADVLNDIASERWNKKGLEFKPEDLEEIPRDEKRRPYTFLHLFSPAYFTQSVLQMLAVLTYSLVNATYLYDVEIVPGGPILHFFYFGAFRVWVPFLIIWLDFRVPRFGRKALYLSSLACTGICFGVNIILLSLGYDETSTVIVVSTILATTVNSSAFYMAIIQITAVCYPTVMRSIAFGTLQIFDSVGAILSNVLIDVLGGKWKPFPYVIPEVFIAVTFVLAVFFQPETKGVDLPDKYKEKRGE